MISPSEREQIERATLEKYGVRLLLPAEQQEKLDGIRGAVERLALNSDQRDWRRRLTAFIDATGLAAFILVIFTLGLLLGWCLAARGAR